MVPDQSESLAVIVGRNFKRIRTRANITQNTMAKHGRMVGLRWTASKVGDFEVGRTSPTFATVLAASAALSWATDSDVTLADLVESDGFVSLTDTFDPRGSVLQELLRGEQSWRDSRAGDVGHTARLNRDPKFFENMRAGFEQASRDLRRYPDAPTTEVMKIQRQSGLDEDRLAKRLNISADLLAAASWQLWQRPFSEERDQRAGPDANAQRRGRLSRVLQAELSAELERVSADGDD